MALSTPSGVAANARARTATAPILIGFADALAAPEAAWSLIDGGSTVVAFARRGSRPALRRARGVTIIEITPPEHDAERARHELAALLSERDFGAVMPLDDTALWLCDRVAEDHPETIVAGPTGPTASLALDKRLQLDAARRAGFAVPPTTDVNDEAELLALEMLPLALKPALPVRLDGTRVARGANHVCGTPQELRMAAQAWGESEPLLAQPLIAGVGEGLFGLAGPGGVTALSAHRRVRMMNPQGSGSSACVSIAVDPELARAAQRMLRDIGWHGLFMLEFLRDRDGTPWFMELNGRTWGSMALARRQGLEYPAWALAQSLDPGFAPVAGGRAHEGQICRHLGRELVHLLMVLRGPRSAALTQWPTRRRALREVLHVRRSDRWYNWRPGQPGVFIEDTIRTVVAVLPGRRR